MILFFCFLFLLSHYLPAQQKELGSIPELFAPEIFGGSNTRLHGFPSISPTGTEMVWPIIPPAVLISYKSDGGWSTPMVAPFSDGRVQAPVYSPDGKRIYFQSNRAGGFGSLDIFYIEQDNGCWNKIYNVGCPPNSEQLESQPTITRTGHLYFCGHKEGKGWNRGIYRSELKNGQYQKPILLDSVINSEAIDIYPFIHPDEKYLIFSSSRPGLSESDLQLYVSHRSESGEWEQPINISRRLGLKGAVRFGCLSPDCQTLYYLLENKIYQVNAKVIPSPNKSHLAPNSIATDTNEPRIVKIKHISPEAVIVYGTPYETNQLILKSAQGLVLVDTGISPRYGALLKQVIQNEFPNETVRYVINTHHHWDHVQGNQIFKEAVFIGHEGLTKAMNRQATTTPKGVELQSLSDDVIPPPPPRPVLTLSTEGYTPTGPNICIQQSLTLDLGNLTLDITSLPGCHSNTDLIVIAREFGITATGDLFFKETLPILEGPNGFSGEQYLTALTLLLDPNRQIRYIVPGHNELLSPHDMTLYHNYISSLIFHIKEAISANQTMAQMVQNMSLKALYPHLISKDSKSNNLSSLHEGNIRNAYQHYRKIGLNNQKAIREDK